MRVKFDVFWAFPIHRCPLRTIGAQPWASMRPSESDHSDFEPGPNPSRSIFTERASRADRMALAVKPCSRHPLVGPARDTLDRVPPPQYVVPLDARPQWQAERDARLGFNELC